MPSVWDLLDAELKRSKEVSARRVVRQLKRLPPEERRAAVEAMVQALLDLARAPVVIERRTGDKRKAR